MTAAGGPTRSLLAAAVLSISQLPDTVLEALFVDLSARAKRLSVPKEVLRLIWDFCADPRRSQVALPVSLSPLVRKQVHILADAMGLEHRSSGNRRKRQLTLWIRGRGRRDREGRLGGGRGEGGLYVADGRGGRLSDSSNVDDEDVEEETQMAKLTDVGASAGSKVLAEGELPGFVEATKKDEVSLDLSQWAPPPAPRGYRGMHASHGSAGEEARNGSTEHRNLLEFLEKHGDRRLYDPGHRAVLLGERSRGSVIQIASESDVALVM